MSHKYTLNECIQIVNCCYFVGSCHSCPAHKHTGYANVVRCVGAKEVGEALLGILEPLSELEKAQNPTLFDIEEQTDDFIGPEEEPTEEQTESQPEEPTISTEAPAVEPSAEAAEATEVEEY